MNVRHGIPCDLRISKAHGRIIAERILKSCSHTRARAYTHIVLQETADVEGDFTLERRRPLRKEEKASNRKDEREAGREMEVARAVSELERTKESAKSARYSA